MDTPEEPMRSSVVVVASGGLAIAMSHVGPIDLGRVGAAEVRAETTFVIPASSRIAVSLERSVPLTSMRAGDTVYFRVISSVRIGNRGAIRSGSFIEATLRDLGAPGLSDQRRELGFRIKRFLYENGDVGDVFAAGGAAPNDTTNGRGIPATVDVARPGDERIIPRGAAMELVVERGFVVAEHRAVVAPVTGDVRVVGSPPHLECYVTRVRVTPDVVLPGTPATPPVGELPGTPGTPDVTIPGTPAKVGTWRLCR
jgi:hypothetical protein